jgi:septal ring factor EnvC (AmiA/AmiB activator)
MCCFLVVLLSSCGSDKSVEVTNEKSPAADSEIAELKKQIGDMKGQLSTIQKTATAQKEVISDMMKQVNELSQMVSQPVTKVSYEDVKDQLAAEIQILANFKYAKKLKEMRLMANIGRLTPALQSRVIEVAHKIEAGKELDRRDVLYLEEANVGDEHIAEFFAKRVSDKDAEAVKNAFGPKDNK